MKIRYIEPQNQELCFLAAIMFEGLSHILAIMVGGFTAVRLVTRVVVPILSAHVVDVTSVGLAVPVVTFFVALHVASLAALATHLMSFA